MVLGANTIVFILIGIVVLLAIWAVRAEIRLNRLLKGKNAANLEDTFNELLSQMKELRAAREDIESYLRGVEMRLKRSIQGIKTVRFNPFKDLGTGSNQSFATAFMDEDGNGVVVSSLYSRDRVSVYSKPIRNGASEYELTEEEKEAVSKGKPEKV